MSVIEKKTRSHESELYAKGLVGQGDQELRILGNMVLAARRNFWVVTILALAAAAFAFLAASLVEDRFTASSRVKLNTRIAQDVQFTIGGPDLPINIASLESELEVMRSSDLIEASIFELELIERPSDTDDEEAMAQFEDDLEKLISTIRDNRVIEQIGTSSAVFEISVTDTNPYLASRLANSLGRQYLERQTLEKVRTLERAQGWLAERTLQIQAQITDLLQQEETYVIESPFSPEEYATITAQRQIGRRQLATMQSDLNDLENRISSIELLNADGQVLAAAELLPEQTAQLTATLANISSVPTNGQAQIINAEISAGVTQLDDRRRRLIEAITTTEASLAELRAKQELQAIHDGEARQIENEIAVAQAIYRDFVSELSRRIEQTEFLDSDGRLIEFARPPRTSSQPNELGLSLAVFIAVMFFGLAAVMFSEISTRRLRTSREFEESCATDLRGIVPHLEREKSVFAQTLNGSASLKFPAMYTAARKLRLSVLATQEHSPRAFAGNDQIKPAAGPKPAARKKHKPTDQRARILAGASSIAGEGQSTSLLAIAQAFAEAGESVLLIDGDFWNSPYKDQLDNPISGEAVNWGTNGQLYDSGVPNLQILPAKFVDATDKTRSDISGFISSKECDQVLAELATKFDRIIIDAPPLLEVPDCVSLLSRAEQVIFFSRWNATDKASVLNAIRILDDVLIKPAFCVATCVRLREVARYGDTTLAYLNRAENLTFG